MGPRVHSKDPRTRILRPQKDPTETITLRLKVAQKPYIVWSLGPKP